MEHGWIKVKLEAGKHSEFKSWCARHGTNMQRQVEWWVTNYCCGEVGKVPDMVVKTLPNPITGPKRAPKEDKQTEGWVGVIRGDLGTCEKCGATGVKTALNKEMKEVCYACAGVKS